MPSFAAGVALFLVDAWRTWRRPQRDHDDPWRAPTLEWLPVGDYGPRSVPDVRGPDPLWQRPALLAEVAAGGHWVPDTTSGGRETLITTPRRALPSHLLLLPDDGWSPLVAAVGTAGFFLLLTVEWIFTAWAFGALAVVAWSSGYGRPTRSLIVRGSPWPTASASRSAPAVGSHSWWATVILLIVIGSVCASFAFAHVHVAMRSEVCPPTGARLPR